MRISIVACIIAIMILSASAAEPPCKKDCPASGIVDTPSKGRENCRPCSTNSVSVDLKSPCMEDCPANGVIKLQGGGVKKCRPCSTDSVSVDIKSPCMEDCPVNGVLKLQGGGDKKCRPCSTNSVSVDIKSPCTKDCPANGLIELQGEGKKCRRCLSDVVSLNDISPCMKDCPESGIIDIPNGGQKKCRKCLPDVISLGNDRQTRRISKKKQRSEWDLIRAFRPWSGAGNGIDFSSTVAPSTLSPGSPSTRQATRVLASARTATETPASAQNTTETPAPARNAKVAPASESKATVTPASAQETTKTPAPSPNATVAPASESNATVTPASAHNATITAMPRHVCRSCPSSIMSVGDGDPHISVELERSTLDRPVCFNLDGATGEVYRLYNVGNGLKVDAELVKSPRPHHRSSTFFGKFIISTDDVKVIITASSVKITTLDQVQTQPWHPWVSHVHPVFYSNGLLRIVHWKRKIIRVNFNGTRFEIKRNLLKYGAKKKDFFYLGIYLERETDTTYGGLVGDALSRKAVYYMANGADHLLIDDARTVAVTSERRFDYLHQISFPCWFIIDSDQLLGQPFVTYKVL